ncbi:GTP-binding protein Der [Pirellulimonas nuda]|uniref:GTP-binding protein Der n=1 Tax=Pirellulimonas nuda TaxID=2528009 RepID=A0A518DJ06_9BACT|nr:DUF697 domain-containing protein [Pirellulimonas nuda]QDU91467.1 GTP-binding protein Der [Pirellulimonas nuda]
MLPNLRPPKGLLALVAVAVLGYLMATMPGTAVEQYRKARELGPLAEYGYLAIAGTGGAMLAGLALWGLWRVGRNTLAGRYERQRRGKNPSELSAADRAKELTDNLAAGRGYGADATPLLRAEIEKAIAQLEAKRDTRRVEVVAFGTISSGKSSLLNAIAGQDAFRTDVVGGTTVTRSTIPWPGADSAVLVDTPGLAEVAGEGRAAEAADAAENADLVLFVVDGPLKAYEHELLDRLREMEKRVVLCLNKADWYAERERNELLDQLREQTVGRVAPRDVVWVRSRETARPQVRVLAGGAEETVETPVPADISPLAERLVEIIRREGGDLLLANLLMQSRGLIDDAKQRVLAALDDEADRVINRYMWAAGGATAVNPVPLLDIAGGSAITVKMVLDLAGVYKQKIDTDTVVEMLAQLGKNLIVMLGATAAAPALAGSIGMMLKTVPGIGTIAGGLLQGVVQALVTQWIGRIFKQYYRRGMQPPEGGLAELARREWAAVTSAEELRKLVRLSRQKVKE